MSSAVARPVFRDLTADDPDPEVTEIESLCMNCHANGTTRLLLTRIPHYKNVVLMSFSCEECGFENNEIQPGGAYADLGVRWNLHVETKQDLNRQVVKSDYTSIRIPELDFEIPPLSQKGEVTTVEGVLSRVVSGLQQDQDKRREQHPAEAAQIDRFLDRLKGLMELKKPFDLVIEDISGNCYVENPVVPHKDPRCYKTEFKRSKEQDHTLGIFTHEETETEPAQEHSYERLVQDEVLTFPTNCPDCNAPADTHMKLTHIPLFKEVVIMATNCDSCGHRTNEVKSGGGIEEQGVRFEVRMASKEDFSRDILKSETCSMRIPELDLEVGGRALGGRFTTGEGLLQATREQLFSAGDAASDRLREFVKKLDEVLAGERAVTILLDDPAGNSHVQRLGEPDHGLKVTRYERTFEQNEELGLNDMKTEGYENAS